MPTKQISEILKELGVNEINSHKTVYWQKEGSFDFLKTEHEQREVGVKISQKKSNVRERLELNSHKTGYSQRKDGVKLP